MATEDPHPTSASDIVAAARLQERRRGAVATYANLFLFIFTLVLFWLQEPGSNPNILFILGYAICQLAASFLYYILPRWRDDLADPGMVADLAPGASGVSRDAEVELERRLPRIGESLWIAAILNLAGVTALIWWTGGPVTSPFAAVPLLMVISGEMLVRVGEIQFETLRDLPRVAIEAISRFRYAVIVALVLYGVLFATELRPHWEKAKVPKAPNGEYLLVIVVNLFVTTVLTYASRAGTDRTGESALFPRHRNGSGVNPCRHDAGTG